jgi:D-alanyl-D-alanine carboxypeptidase
MSYRKITRTLLLVAVSAVAKADHVDEYIKTQMKFERIPGLSMAVVRDGKVVKSKAYGAANLETETPATPATVYKIASVSKQFLAAGIMLLVQQGKIGLDDPLTKYIEDIPKSWEGITLTHLLTHTSGIARESPGFDPLKVQADADVIKATYSLPLTSAPGARWAYSNINYYCLAEVIRKTTGEPWSKFIADNIFAPTGMTATRTTTATDIVPNRATGYSSREKGFANAELWLALRPSGAFLSTVLDLAKWDAALYSDSVLSSASRSKMWTPVRLNDGTTSHYGFGWFLDSIQGHQRIHHGGGVPGFACEFDRFVDDKLTVILMANIGGRDLGDLAVNVAGFYVPALMPPPIKPVPDPEPQMTAQVKAIVMDLAQGKLDSSPFTPEMATRVRNGLQGGGYAFLTNFGARRAFYFIERITQGGETSYRYYLAYPRLDLFVECTRGPDNKIAKFDIHD